MPIVKSVGGMSRRKLADDVDGQAEDLADQVVQRDIERALRRPVASDRPLEQGAGDDEAVLGRLEGHGVESCDQQGEHGGHRLGCLAVEAVRIALPHPDQVRVVRVPKLHDDRRDPRPLGVLRAGDPERVAQGERQDLVREAQTHGRASTASRTAGHSRSAPNRTGSSAGSPVSAWIDAMTARASSSDGYSDVLSATATTFDGAIEPGDPLVELDERQQRGDRERRFGQVGEVVLGQPRLVDEDHRVRRRTMDQGHRHGAVGRMVDRALALDDHPVAPALALLDEPLHRTVAEVADDPVHRHAPALDHHPGLAGRDHDRRSAVAPRGRDQLEGDRHLADRAVGADGQDHALARQVPAPDRGLHPIRRSSIVDEPDTGRGGGRREPRVVAQELVQPGVDVQPGRDRIQDDRAPGGREAPTGRGDPDQQAIGPDRAAKGLVERRDERDVERRQELAQVPTGHRRVEDRHDLVAPVADDTHRGLCIVDAELPLGQDDQATGRGGKHVAESRESRTPPGRGPGASGKAV